MLGRPAGFIFLGVLVLHLANSVLGSKPLGAIFLGAIVADILARRAGTPWDEHPAAQSAKELGRGAIFALLAVAIAYGVGAATGSLIMGKGTPSIDGIGLGILRSAGLAFRDEMFYRWIPFYVAATLAPSNYRALFVVLLGAVPTLEQSTYPVQSFVVTLAQGSLSAVFLLKSTPFATLIGAQATLIFLTSSVFPSLVGLSWKVGGVIPLHKANGPGAWFLTLGLLVAAAVAMRFTPKSERSPFESSPSGR